MAKALKTAALVVGAVALVATGVGAAVGAGIIAASAATATIATVASIATLASVGLSVATALTAKKPSSQATGSQTSFSAAPDAGIPLVIGRTGTAGDIVFRRGWDTKDAGDNDRQVFVSVLSLGPVAEVEPTLGVDRAPVSFDAQGRAIGTFRDWMWRTVQVGLLSSAALGFGTGAGAAPGWTAQHRLSGKAATAWTLRFDTKAKFFQNGVPAPMNVVKGQFCYDPRKDSTYPGGSGPHRMADPADRAAYDAAVATWQYSDCPYLNGLRYAHGYWQRDMSDPASNWQRVMGMGAPLAGIDVASFVEGANVSDANGWKVGGVIYSGDDKWGSLKKILQAGMGEPLALGAKVSCLVNAPKVSLATITIDDVVGDASVGATQPRRDRVNTITPRFRLEENNWQLLPGAPISVAQHVADDRGKRSRTQDYPFIQNASQVGTAVRYDIENAREFGPIVLPCKLFWMGYKPGDCVTAELPELGLVAQPILLLNRALNPSSGTVTLTARSETPGKHAFALGQTATPPPTPGVTGAPIVPVPGVDAWAITGNSVQANGVTMPALVVDGAVDAATAQSVTFDYRPFVSGQGVDDNWIGAGVEAPDVTTKIITGVASATAYEVSVRYTARGTLGGRRILGPVTSAAYFGLKGDKGDNAPLVLVQWSIDGSTNWHFEYQTGDKFQRQSNDNGANWGPAVRVVGESAQSGVDGISPSIVFIRSATVPATPSQDTGNPPPGWSDDPPVGTTFLWQSVSKFRGGMQLEGWSSPVRISGADGKDGASAVTLIGSVASVIIDRNSARGTAGQPWGSEAVYSRESYTGGAVCTFTYPALHGDDIMAGLSQFTSAQAGSMPGDGFNSVTFSIFRNSNGGTTDVRINGEKWADGPVVSGELRGRVHFDGRYVRWYINEAQIGSPFDWMRGTDDPNAAVHALRFRAALAASNPTINNVTLSASGATAPLVRTQWSIDGSTNWHDNYMGADLFYRQSNDGGANYGPAIRGVGESGTGVGVAFKRSAAVPATPGTNTGNPPSGWSDGPPAGTDFLWLTKANFLSSVQQTAWSAPQRISGEPGTDGFSLETTTPVFAIPAFSGGTVKPSWTGGSGVAQLRKGGVTVGGVGFSIIGLVGVTGAAIDGNGNYSFSSVTGLEGSFTIRATYQGQVYDRKISVKKVLDGSAAFQASSNFTGTDGSGSTVVPGNRLVTISGFADYQVTGGPGGQGQYIGTIYLYYRNVTDNGGQVLMGSAQGTYSTRVNQSEISGEPDYVETPGSASAAFQFTSPPGDKVFEYRAFVSGSGSGNVQVAIGGNARLEVSA